MKTDLATRRNNKPLLFEFRAMGLDASAVDRTHGVIKGVSLITSGVQARGHDLHVDETTLEQIEGCAGEMGQVPVKWNHKTGADSVNGYLTNFRREGNKTKGDWHLLKTHSQYEQAMELAERMPGNIGLSCAFVGKEESKAGRKFARCEELISVDLVAQPAANPDGLFGAVVDTREPIKFMNDKSGQNQDVQEPTLAELKELLQTQSETISQLKEQMGQMQDSQRGDGELTAEELQQIAQLDDATLADLDLTRAEVDEAIAAAMSGGEGGEGDFGGEGEFEPAQRGGGEMAGAGAGRNGSGGGADAVGAELASLRRKVTELSRKEELKEQRSEAEALEQYFGSIEEKVALLAARNEALETALEAGGGAVEANGEITFHRPGQNGGKLTEFEEAVESRMAADTSDASPTRKRANAVRQAQKENRAAYQKHLEAKGARLTHL